MSFIIADNDRAVALKLVAGMSISFSFREANTVPEIDEFINQLKCKDILNWNEK